MAQQTWDDLKSSVASVIKANGNNEITGQTLQSTLSSIINNLGKNATFAGLASPSLVPDAIDGPVFYLATQKGVYANFDGITITGPSIIFKLSKTPDWVVEPLTDEKIYLDRLTITPTGDRNVYDISFQCNSPQIKRLIQDGYKIVLFRYCNIRSNHTGVVLGRVRGKSKRGWHMRFTGSDNNASPLILEMHFSDGPTNYAHTTLRISDLFSYYKSNREGSSWAYTIRHGNQRIRIAPGGQKKLKFGIGLVQGYIQGKEAQQFNIQQIIPFYVPVRVTSDGFTLLVHRPKVL